MIITDQEYLKQKSQKAGWEEGLEIIEKLKGELDETPGLGLSAPQIGILKRVVLLRTPKGINNPEREDTAFINPIIQEKYDACIFKGESCLSIPGQSFDTNRFRYAKVADDLHPDGLVLCDVSAICIQHEVDHLDGILYLDHLAQIDQKIRRNDPCPICSAKGKKIKYKKCLEHNPAKTPVIAS